MIILYNFLNILLLPIHCIILIVRLIKSKETLLSLRNRFGFSQKSRPQGNIIWIHAASVGEATVAMTLIRVFQAKYDQYNFLVTTNTISSARFIKKANLNNCIHQFIPIDNIIFVQKFLKYWQPNLAIFVESELWPCLISSIPSFCKLILVGGRLSDKSFNIWMKFPKLFQIMMHNFSALLLQSEKDLRKYQTLGINDATNLGNPKFSNQILPFDENKSQMLKNILKDKFIFVAASTHAEDEEVIFDTFTKLKNYKNNSQELDFYPIIILRHPHRSNEVIKYCEEFGLKYSLKSQNQIPNLEDDLYIVDTFGELGLFYSVSDLTFVGGSFKMGGHNVLEPAFFKNLIIVGPDMSNFYDITSEMLNNNLIFQIDNAEELYNKIIFCYNNKSSMDLKKMQNNVNIFVENKSQIIDKYVKKIEEFLLNDKT